MRHDSSVCIDEPGSVVSSSRRVIQPGFSQRDFHLIAHGGFGDGLNNYAHSGHHAGKFCSDEGTPAHCHESLAG
jgi:hypothetical protein